MIDSRFQMRRVMIERAIYETHPLEKTKTRGRRPGYEPADAKQKKHTSSREVGGAVCARAGKGQSTRQPMMQAYTRQARKQLSGIAAAELSQVQLQQQLRDEHDNKHDSQFRNSIVSYLKPVPYCFGTSTRCPKAIWRVLCSSRRGRRIGTQG